MATTAARHDLHSPGHYVSKSYTDTHLHLWVFFNFMTNEQCRGYMSFVFDNWLSIRINNFDGPWRFIFQAWSRYRNIPRSESRRRKREGQVGLITERLRKMETGIITLNIRRSDGFIIMRFWLRHLVISALVLRESQQNTDWVEVMEWY